MALVEEGDIFFARDLLAVGRNRIHVLPAEMEWRHVVIARREIAWVIGR